METIFNLNQREDSWRSKPDYAWLLFALQKTLVQLALWARWFKCFDKIPEITDLVRLSHGDIPRTSPFERWVAKQMVLIMNIHDILPLRRHYVPLF